MKQQRIKEITFDALIISLVVLLTIIKPLGYPKLGLLNATTIHIPIIIGILHYKRLSKALLFGLVFGLSSLVNNLFGSSPFSPFFINPLVSILPRLFMALTGFLIAKKLHPYLSTFVMSFSNTFFVMLSLGFLYKTQIEELGFKFSSLLATVSVFSALPEAIIATIVVRVYLKTLEGR